MNHPRRDAIPSKAAAALELLTAKRREQEARRAFPISNRDEKENDADSLLNDFDSPDLKPMKHQQHFLQPTARPLQQGGLATNIDALTGSLASLAMGPRSSLPPMHQPHQQPPHGGLHEQGSHPAQVYVASQLPLPADSDSDDGNDDDDNDDDDDSDIIISDSESQEEAGATGPSLFVRFDGGSSRTSAPSATPSSSFQAKGGGATMDPMVLGDKGEFKLDGRVASKLYPHQVEGVKWLWSLHQLKRGGILGDDMGLGGTL